MESERTFFERVQDALGRLREHLRSLVSESAATELRGQLEASEREKTRIVETLERFVDETVPAAETDTATDPPAPTDGAQPQPDAA